jgi:phospholipase D1/2
VRDLFVAELAAAQRSIYIETQYLSSHVIGDALARRMRVSQPSKLEIVIVLNMQAETFKEQLAVGLAQAKIIGELREVAATTGHHLGFYYSVPHCDAGEHCDRATYIHSKLLIVDDRVLSIGSANLSNRSMSVDTELTTSVESEMPDGELEASLRRLRTELLTEHTGGGSDLDLETADGLVARLDDLAKRAATGEPEHAGFRLRTHPSPTEDERKALEIIDPQALPFDPDVVEDLHGASRSIFVGGFGAALRRLLAIP